MFSLQVGLKTDPVEYRQSYEWLFRLMQEEGVRFAQLGSVFEFYHLPDSAFVRLRETAGRFDVEIRSTFTTHRELGGFFTGDADWEGVARRNYERAIEIGALLGAESVGSNPGSVLRDRMETKERGLACYLRNMMELMEYAAAHGVRRLTIEPMSCLAEPPTLPDEIREMGETLSAHHAANPERTADIGFCSDVAHGYVSADGRRRCENFELLEAAVPHLTELHLKNTDSRYDSTFGFEPWSLRKGVVRLSEVRDFLMAHASQLPVSFLIGYVEIGGPKLGRDYSDCQLEESLRLSLRHAREHFAWTGQAAMKGADEAAAPGKRVELAPSVMCADVAEYGRSLDLLEAGGVEWLHFDLMDGHFAPNIPTGLELLKATTARARKPVDVHLMVEDNDFFIREVARLGARRVSIHAESATHLDRSLGLIRSLGMEAGLALNPATPLSALDYVADSLDCLLLMTVNPGFAGQSMVPGALRKIEDGRAYLDRRGRDIPIMVDGNVSFENIPGMVAAGASILVCGSSSVFHPGGDILGNIERTRAAAASGLARRAAAKEGPRVEPR